MDLVFDNPSYQAKRCLSVFLFVGMFLYSFKIGEPKELKFLKIVGNILRLKKSETNRHRWPKNWQLSFSHLLPLISF